MALFALIGLSFVIVGISCLILGLYRRHKADGPDVGPILDANALIRDGVYIIALGILLVLPWISKRIHPHDEIPQPISTSEKIVPDSCKNFYSASTCRADVVFRIFRRARAEAQKAGTSY